MPSVDVSEWDTICRSGAEQKDYNKRTISVQQMMIGIVSGLVLMVFGLLPGLLQDVIPVSTTFANH